MQEKENLKTIQQIQKLNHMINNNNNEKLNDIDIYNDGEGTEKKEQKEQKENEEEQKENMSRSLGKEEKNNQKQSINVNENFEPINEKNLSHIVKTSNILLNDRDRLIMHEISRWKCIQGRHIKILTGFDGQRACDRRLKKLIDNNYIERHRYIYGISGIYNITNKAKKQFGLELPIGEIRLDQIEHDIAVVDTAIYVIKKLEINQDDITSEKQLRNKQGFTKRTHLPDFTYTKDNKIYCVEVELSLKAKDRFEKNIKQNYTDYESQKWIVPINKVKIREILQNNSKKYINIEILDLETIQEYIKTLENQK